MSAGKGSSCWEVLRNPDAHSSGLVPCCRDSGLNYIPPMSDHIDRYVPADTNGGWGVAAGVIVFTVLCIVTVTYIHKQTYRHPTDVTWHGKGSGDAAPPRAGEAGR
jgi:hypothetical protein